MYNKTTGSENLLSGLDIVSYKRKSDEHWTTLEITNEIEDLCTFSPEELIHNDAISFSSLICPDDKLNAELTIAEKIAVQESYEIEYQLCIDDHPPVWVFDKGKGNYDQSGNLQYLSGIIINITKQKLLEIRLNESNKSFRYLANQFESILDHIPGLVFYKDDANNFVRVNKYVADAYAMSKFELEGKNLSEFHTSEEAQKYLDADLEVIQSGIPKIDITEPWLTPNGLAWLNTSKIPYTDENGKIIGIIGISFDITKRVETELKIKILEQAMEQAPDAIVITEPDGTICYVNNSFLNVTGYTKEEAMGKKPSILKYNNDAQVDYKELWETILSGKEWHGVFQNINKAGEAYWERSSISPVYDDQSKLIKFVGIKENITKEHQNELELERLHKTDMLTNVTNRRGFFEMAEKEILRNMRYPQSSVVMMLDIDHFKKINDIYGHSMGDVALRQFADVCSSTIRTTDFIGRIGGEEFAIFLINTNQTAASIVAERLRKNIESITLLSDSKDIIKFTVSIGLTELKQDDNNFDNVLKRADKALYAAKHKGRNRVEWYNAQEHR